MEYAAWINTLTEGLRAVWAQTVTYLPRVLAALVVLLAGWVVARVMRGASLHLAQSVDRLWHRLVLRGNMEAIQAKRPPARVVGEVVFWVVVLLFVTLAADILGLNVFVTWLTQAVTYLPLLVAGLLIILAGYVISHLVRDLVVATAATAGLSHGELLGRLSQAVILLTAIVIGVDQIGVDVTFLSVIAGVVFATTLGGIALAFAAGAKAHVANLIASQSLRRRFRAGDLIRVGDKQGRVIEVTTTHVILDTEEGEAVIPASLFESQTALLIERGS